MIKAIICIQYVIFGILFVIFLNDVSEWMHDRKDGACISNIWIGVKNNYIFIIGLDVLFTLGIIIFKLISDIQFVY